MYALRESAERIIALMEELLSCPPKEAPSVEEMFKNLEHFLGAMGSTRVELKGMLLALISQALRLENLGLNTSVNLVDFLKNVKREEKSETSPSEPVDGLENWFSDKRFQDALARADNNSDLAPSLRCFSDSRRILYYGTFEGPDVNNPRRVEVILSGIKYPRSIIDMNIKLYSSGEIEADMFLSELLLRSPWKVASLESAQFERSLQEVMYLGSRFLTSLRRP